MPNLAVWLFVLETDHVFPDDYIMLLVRNNGNYFGITFNGAPASETRLMNEIEVVEKSTGWERIA